MSGADAAPLSLEDLGQHIVIVLVQPLEAGNIGAVVRGMANTGLKRLVVVDPPSLDLETVRWLAPGCEEAVARMQIVATLDEALVGVQRVIATTGRHRKAEQSLLGPRSAAEEVLSDARLGDTTAILFGREDTGLPNDVVDRCEKLLRIPTAFHTSLNLGQAALLISWEIYAGWLAGGGRPPPHLLGGNALTDQTDHDERRIQADQPMDVTAHEPLVAAALELLEKAGYNRSTAPEKVARTLRALLQRSRPRRRELEALRGMIATVTKVLGR